MLDTCILKLATLPHPGNKAAVIVELCLRQSLRAYVTPDILGEYQRVLHDEPEFLEEVRRNFRICMPLFTATAIEHEPDNRILECALACEADALVTVNTAAGHFDAAAYHRTRVATPGTSFRWPKIRAILRLAR